jgi:hypothetical protein
MSRIPRSALQVEGVPAEEKGDPRETRKLLAALGTFIESSSAVRR